MTRGNPTRLVTVCDFEDICFTDSHIPRAFTRLVITEEMLRGCTLEEAETLVMGGDDGDIPRALTEKFPELNAALNTLWEGWDGRS